VKPPTQLKAVFAKTNTRHQFKSRLSQPWNTAVREAAIPGAVQADGDDLRTVTA
jgi:hypothetical protein